LLSQKGLLNGRKKGLRALGGGGSRLSRWGAGWEKGEIPGKTPLFRSECRDRVENTSLFRVSSIRSGKHIHCVMNTKWKTSLFRSEWGKYLSPPTLFIVYYYSKVSSPLFLYPFGGAAPGVPLAHCWPHCWQRAPQVAGGAFNNV
jgi:hypothetical protein